MLNHITVDIDQSGNPELARGIIRNAMVKIEKIHKLQKEYLNLIFQTRDYAKTIEELNKYF
jgi:hypothetical protein